MGSQRLSNFSPTLCVMCGFVCLVSVDDLNEIGKLEEYVNESQCLLVFLSKGYFFRLAPECTIL